MQHVVTTKKPFSFAQALTFIERFPPCQQEVITTPDSVTCTTLTRARTRRGKAYLRFIRYVHPVVVRAMLRRALAVRTAPVPGASAV